MKFKVEVFDKSVESDDKKTEHFLNNIEKEFVLFTGNLQLQPELECIYKRKMLDERVKARIISYRLESIVMRELSKQCSNLWMFKFPYREATHFLVADKENVWVEDHSAGCVPSGIIYWGAPEIAEQYLDNFSILMGEAKQVSAREIDNVFPKNPIRKEVKTVISRKFNERYLEIIKAL